LPTPGKKARFKLQKIIIRRRLLEPSLVQGHETFAQVGQVPGIGLNFLAQEFPILLQIDPVGKEIIDDFFLDVNF